MSKKSVIVHSEDGIMLVKNVPVHVYSLSRNEWWIRAAELRLHKVRIIKLYKEEIH